MTPSISDLPQPPHGNTGWPWTVASPPLPKIGPGGQPWPGISIVTPSYNQAQFIEETIRSVLLQGYPELEYIIMDGGSTDGSVEIIRKYAPFLSHWVSEKDGGQSQAINNGLAMTKGELIGWLNSDDFFAPGALAKLAEAHAKSPGAGAIRGRGHKINERKEVFYSPHPQASSQESLLKWCFGETFMQPACLFTRAAWHSAGPLRTDLDYCMDLALWWGICSKYEFLVINDDIAFANTHSAAKTMTNRELMFAETALLTASWPDGFADAKRLLFERLNRLLEPRRHLVARLRDDVKVVLRRAASATVRFFPFSRN
jgi:glycosyltransferase involved in cell wall biosynthesis